MRQQPKQGVSLRDLLAAVGLLALLYILWPLIASFITALGQGGTTAVPIQNIQNSGHLTNQVRQIPAPQVIIVTPAWTAPPTVAPAASTVGGAANAADIIHLSTGPVERATAEFWLRCAAAQQNGGYVPPDCPANPAAALGQGR
jgi:hypothetical protein